MQQQGQARQVGVSNFLIDQLEDLAAQGLPKPVLQPVGGSSWYPQREVRAYCHRQGIRVVCWAPLFRGAWKEAPVLAQIAQAHGKTPAQAVLRWHVQNGDCPIPKSVTPSRIAENLDIFDFALTPEEMAANRRPGGRPPYLPTIPIPTTAPAKASSPLRPRALGAPGPCLAPRPYTPPCLPGFRRCTILLWQFLFGKNFN